MEGVTPPPTLPAPGSSGVTAAIGADDDAYGGAVAIVADVVESPPLLPTGAGYAALTDEVAENGVALVAAGAPEFIEVGPISVVLNGVSPLDGAA